MFQISWVDGKCTKKEWVFNDKWCIETHKTSSSYNLPSLPTFLQKNEAQWQTTLKNAVNRNINLKESIKLLWQVQGWKRRVSEH